MSTVIGPYNNKDKPADCPQEWWDKYANWLPKEWVGFLMGDKMQVIPYYPLEQEIFDCWKDCGEGK